MNEAMRELNNQKALSAITESEPYWFGVCRADHLLENYDPETILHSGPPIPYEKMCGLHRRGMINGCILEGFAKTEEEADRLLKSGKIKIDSAMNYNTVGSGTGIITRSVPLLVVVDNKTGKKAGVFPHEGKFGGGFCGWGVYSQDIADNLRYMRDTLFAPITAYLNEIGGFPLGDIMPTGVLMGDENHSSQRAVDALFIRKFIPYAFKVKNAEELLTYFSSTWRFFHNFGQSIARVGILGAIGIEGSSMVTAAGGNGVEYGIKVAGLGDSWFTAPSPMIEGRYMVDGAKREDQLPWIGDSSIVECAGLGGILSAASPEVCSWRGDKIADGIRITRDMEKITIGKNSKIKVPNLDFDFAPAGMDIFKVAETGILPVIDGGMINREGGWMGAGCARIPLACFTEAVKAYNHKYQK